MSSVLIHLPDSIFHGNGIQISSMDYVTMSDNQFSYDLLKIEGEDVEKYMNDAINAISTANDVDLIIQEEGTMKGGSVMYEKFREMIDYVKQTTSDAITGRKKMLDELLTPINKPVIESTNKEQALKEEKEKNTEEAEPLEKEEKDEEESVKKEEGEEPVEIKDINESKSEEPKKEQEPEKEEKASSDSEVPASEEEISETHQNNNKESEELSEKKEEDDEDTEGAEEEDTEGAEEEEEEDEEFANVSDDEGEPIIHTEIEFKKKNEDTLMEVLELKMTKLAFQSEN